MNDFTKAAHEVVSVVNIAWHDPAHGMLIGFVLAGVAMLGGLRYKEYRKERKDAKATVDRVPDPKPVKRPPHSPRT